MSRGRCWETEEPKDCIKGYHVYMKIWKLLVDECLQCVIELINGVNNNAAFVVRTNSLCKREVVGHVQQISMTVSMSLSLPHCTMGIFATGKRFNHRVEYVLEIFLYLRRSLNWLKKEKRSKEA